MDEHDCVVGLMIINEDGFFSAFPEFEKYRPELLRQVSEINTVPSGLRRCRACDLKGEIQQESGVLECSYYVTVTALRERARKRHI